MYPWFSSKKNCGFQFCRTLSFIHMPRTPAFTLENLARKTECIFEKYMVRGTFWRKNRNRTYSRFWFIVLSIKQTAPSSENSKSFINWNFLVGPGLRKKNVEKTQFFSKLRDFYLLNRDLKLQLLSTEKSYWEISLYIKWSLVDGLSDLKTKIWIFAPKYISNSTTTPSSGYSQKQNWS